VARAATPDGLGGSPGTPYFLLFFLPPAGFLPPFSLPNLLFFFLFSSSIKNQKNKTKKKKKKRKTQLVSSSSPPTNHHLQRLLYQTQPKKSILMPQNSFLKPQILILDSKLKVNPFGDLIIIKSSFSLFGHRVSADPRPARPNRGSRWPARSRPAMGTAKPKK
jgi:hypothetical protein